MGAASTECSRFMSGEQAGSPDIQPDYPTDLWGNPAELPRVRHNRRGKNGVVYIGGLTLQQERLFSPEEMQVPFPVEPVNKTPDLSEEAAIPGTLFYRPEPAPRHAQQDLFIPVTESLVTEAARGKTA